MNTQDSYQEGNVIYPKFKSTLLKYQDELNEKQREIFNRMLNSLAESFRARGYTSLEDDSALIEIALILAKGAKS